METEKLTPEYIVSIKETITDEEFIELIRDYGNEQADNANYWSDKH